MGRISGVFIDLLEIRCTLSSTSPRISVKSIDDHKHKCEGQEEFVESLFLTHGRFSMSCKQLFVDF